MAQTVTTSCGFCYQNYSQCGQFLNDNDRSNPGCCPEGYTHVGETDCNSCMYVNNFGEDIEGKRYICTMNAPPVNCFADSSQVNNPECYDSLNGYCTGSNLDTQLCKDFCLSQGSLCDTRKLALCTSPIWSEHWEYCSPLLQTYCSSLSNMDTAVCKSYCSTPEGAVCPTANQWCQGSNLEEETCKVYCRENAGQCDVRLQNYCAGFTRNNAPEICGCFLADPNYGIKILNSSKSTNYPLSCDRICNVLVPRPTGLPNCGVTSLCTDENVVAKQRLEEELNSGITVTDCETEEPPPNPNPTPNPSISQKVRDWIMKNPGYVILIVLSALIVILLAR